MKVPQIGDSVRVKKGVKDILVNVDLGGCQGRITRIIDDECPCCGHKVTIFEVDFDSITMKQMSPEMIKLLNDDGCDFSQNEFTYEEITVVKPRDTKAQAKATRKELHKKYDGNQE